VANRSAWSFPSQMCQARVFLFGGAVRWECTWVMATPVSTYRP
jgi:hypothetical protein